MEAYAYARQLKQLLPPGGLWSLVQDSVLSKLLLGVADELVRIDGRAQDLLNEWDPRAATETLEDWEFALGITPVTGATTAERRLLCATKLLARGGATPLYFAFLAVSMGFVVGAIAYPAAHVWRMPINLATSTSPFGLVTQEFRAGASRAPDRLNSWTVPELENEINRLKPAHTRALFVYTS